MSEQQLRKFFNFDESDLAANRAGQLSPKQKKTLEDREKSTDQFLVIVGGALVLGAAVVTYFMSQGAFPNGFTPGALGQLALRLAIPDGLMLFFGIGALRIASKKMDRTVMKAQGKVSFVKVERQEEVLKSDGSHDYYRKIEQYEMRVGGEAFDDVDDELVKIIEQGEAYTFYYAKDGKIILSAEPA